jgi:hypothetical protein
MKIIGILVAITCLTMGDAAQAACRTLADAYQLQRDARVLDTTSEQLEIMLNAGLLARAAVGDQTATRQSTPARISPLRRRCTARWTWASGSSRRGWDDKLCQMPNHEFGLRQNP